MFNNLQPAKNEMFFITTVMMQNQIIQGRLRVRKANKTCPYELWTDLPNNMNFQFTNVYLDISNMDPYTLLSTKIQT